MNKIFYYICLALLPVLALTSCNDDFLEDAGPYGTFTDDIFQSESQTTMLVSNIYYNFYHGYTTPQYALLGSWTDDFFNMTEEKGGSIENWIKSGTVLEDADDGYAYYGSKLSTSNKNEPYTRIRFCQTVIEKLDEIGGDYLSESFINETKGQMYYLEALQYFELMRIYGGVPLVTSVQNASSSDESIKLPRETVTNVVSLIVEYLDKAAELLPDEWTDSESDYGRPVAGAALAYKQKVLLTFASPLFNKNWDSDDTRWQTALDAGLKAEEALTAAGYGLFGSSAADWESMFLVDNSFCSEAVWVRLLSSGDSDDQNGWENSIRPTSQGGGGGISAPKAMVDLFPMSDGSRPTVENGYDDFLYFKDRDPRFYRTFSFSGAMWNYNGKQDTVWVYSWLNSSSSRSFSNSNENKSPVLVRKMSNPSADASNFAASGTDIFQFRYAELLLNIAECYAALGQTSNTLEYLGKIRARVGIPSSNNYGIGMLSDKYEALEACLYERRVELAYEGKRFWDIQRWMLYDDDQTYNSGNNTCDKLGIDPLNGTARQGYYLQSKITSTDDPLESTRMSVYVDIDATDFEDQIDALATFYTENFDAVDLDSPMDQSSGEENLISWQPNYYIMGLTSTVLSQNDWLEQTIGWNDYYTSAGTYDWLEE